MSSLRFENVSKDFKSDGKSFVALESIDLVVEDKEFVAIVGPSGCGKTTCLRMVAGFETASRGRVLVDGSPVRGPGPDRAVVFQHFALFPWKTVRDNIAFGLRNGKLSASERNQRVAAAIDLMSLKGFETAYPHQLSGGMQQRVAIARVYVLEPKVLLMDEPFGALDAQTRVVMQEELLRIARLNPRTVLFITHSVEEAIYLADRVVVMTPRPGRIKEIVDIQSVRAAEGWDSFDRVEDVMDREGFIHLRSHIWKTLRETKF